LACRSWSRTAEHGRRIGNEWMHESLVSPRGCLLQPIGRVPAMIGCHWLYRVAVQVLPLLPSAARQCRRDVLVESARRARVAGVASGRRSAMRAVAKHGGGQFFAAEPQLELLGNPSEILEPAARLHGRR
jgi:hypothetical protein